MAEDDDLGGIFHDIDTDMGDRGRVPEDLPVSRRNASGVGSRV